MAEGVMCICCSGRGPESVSQYPCWVAHDGLALVHHIGRVSANEPKGSRKETIFPSPLWELMDTPREGHGEREKSLTHDTEKEIPMPKANNPQISNYFPAGGSDTDGATFFRWHFMKWIRSWPKLSYCCFSIPCREVFLPFLNPWVLTHNSHLAASKHLFLDPTSPGPLVLSLDVNTMLIHFLLVLADACFEKTFVVTYFFPSRVALPWKWLVDNFLVSALCREKCYWKHLNSLYSIINTGLGAVRHRHCLPEPTGASYP